MGESGGMSSWVWRAELRELRETVARLEKRLLETAKRLYISYMVMMTISAPPAKQRYIAERRGHYSKLISDSKDENEMSNHVDDFLKEVTTYLQSG